MPPQFLDAYARLAHAPIILGKQVTPEAEKSLREWFKLCAWSVWSGFSDARATFRTADQVGDKIVVNIMLTDNRPIFKVRYQKGLVLVKRVGTYGDYDRRTRRQIEEL